MKQDIADLKNMMATLVASIAEKDKQISTLIATNGRQLEELKVQRERVGELGTQVRLHESLAPIHTLIRDHGGVVWNMRICTLPSQFSSAIVHVFEHMAYIIRDHLIYGTPAAIDATWQTVDPIIAEIVGHQVPNEGTPVQYNSPLSIRNVIFSTWKCMNTCADHARYVGQNKIKCITFRIMSNMVARFNQILFHNGIAQHEIPMRIFEYVI
jgi:hypothetical protein